MKFCPTCRTPLADDETKCISCGCRFITPMKMLMTIAVIAMVVVELVAGIIFALHHD